MSIAVLTKHKGVFESMVEHLLQFCINDIDAQVMSLVLGKAYNKQDLYQILQDLQDQTAVLPENIDFWRAEKAARTSKLQKFYNRVDRGKVLWRVVQEMEHAYCEFRELCSVCSV